MNSSHAISHNYELTNNKSLNAIIGVAFFMIATTLGAYVRIPMPGTPVPITLQTFFVVMAGAVLGKKLGLYSQLGYLMAGIFGIPVFQGYACGIIHIFGPTGGYLVGFIGAAYLVARLTANRPAGIRHIALAFIAGNLVIYSCGILWLVIGYKYSLSSAFSAGLLPFVPAEAAKVAAASLLYSKIARRSREIFSA